MERDANTANERVPGNPDYSGVDVALAIEQLERALDDKARLLTELEVARADLAFYKALSLKW